VAAAVFLISIGSPLLGVRVFHGTDLLLDRAPWRTTHPDVLRASNRMLDDTVSTYMPLRAEVRRRLREDDFPTWTSLPGGGQPLGSVPLDGTLGPLTLPYLVLPLWYAPGLAKLLEMAVAMTFTALFLRRLHLERAPALLGGFIYAMSGFQVVWTNWPPSHVGALVPAVLWATERAIQEQTVRSGVLVTVTVAAIVFQGFPSVAGYALVAATAFALTRLIVMRNVPVRRRVGVIALLAGAVGLGLGLTALQTMPLARRAAILDLGYRVQAPDQHLPPIAAATLAVPDAMGSPVDDTYFGPLNYVEVQSFIGASSLVMVAAAAAWPARRVVRGARGFLWTGAALTSVVLYLGGPLLVALQTSSLFRLNFMPRVRSVLGLLLAGLAALGLQSLMDLPGRGRGRWRAVAVWAGAAVLSGLGLVALWRTADGAGQVELVARQTVLPAAIGAGAVATVWLSRRIRPPGIPLAAVVVPPLFAAEALAFALPFWPRVDRDLFYPRTAAHAELQGRLGGDRLVGAGGALYPGTTTFYGIRSLSTNHPLPQIRAWEDLIRVADPEAFARSPVSPSLEPRKAVAASPVLDRLAVRYFVTPPTRVFGRRVPVPALGADVIGPGRSVRTVVPGGPIRGIVVRLSGAAGLGPESRVMAELRDDRGEVVGRGSQFVFSRNVPGDLQVPVVEPRCSGVACPSRYTLDLQMAGPGRVVLDASDSSSAPLSVIVPGDDGLRVDVVENVVGYRRLHALPRIRWAARARVILDADARIEVLAEGASPEEVILSRAGPAGSGLPADLDVQEDGGDTILVMVDAAGPGYLVVADPLLPGWEASVDGSPASLRAADHGVAAVLVPEGEHHIELRHDPPGWRLGIAISAVSALILVLATVISLVRRKPSTGPAPRAMLSGAMTFRDRARD